jgi:hypothetical protein
MMANYTKNNSIFSKKDDIVICKSFLEKGLLDEPALAKQLGRMPRNILYRWIYHILPSIKIEKDLQSDAFKDELKLKIKELENAPFHEPRRRFTKEEDETILMLVDRFGKDWNIISEEMKTRSADSVFHRYTSSLKPGLKNIKVPFTKEEDDIIREFMETKGKNIAHKWAYLSRDKLPSRSPNSMRYRWKVLNTDTSPITLNDYKKYLQSLTKFGPDFVKISKEQFPRRDPVFLRNFWIKGLGKQVPDFFTLKWTREIDQKLIDICMSKGFDRIAFFRKDFPQIHDLIELNYRLDYLFRLIPPHQKTAPSIPLDSEFDRLRNSCKNNTSILQIRGYNDLHYKYKIPKRLIQTRKTVFDQVKKPFTKEEDELLVKLVMKSLEKDPLGPHSSAALSKNRSEKAFFVHVENPVLWSDICFSLKRKQAECRIRWTQLKYDLYH